MDEVTRMLFEEAGVHFRNIERPLVSVSPKYCRPGPSHHE
jgi:hypothetical protein